MTALSSTTAGIAPQLSQEIGPSRNGRPAPSYARSERKGRSWHLAAATYRRLGEKAAYVHQRGFEPVQQEQMVLQYVEKHSRITRVEAAELFKVSPDHAYRLLQRLTKSGGLTRLGTKKGAWYERRA